MQTTIDVRSAKAAHDAGKVLMLDVRTPAEYGEVHIPGSTLMPLDRLNARKLQDEAGDRPCVLVCRSGKRAEQARQKLAAAGAIPLAVLEGGVSGWEGAGLPVRAELFIVTAVIAWTYLLHAWFKREGIDYRHTKMEKGQRVVLKTPNGADKYWELAQCLKHARCPVEQGAADNLLYLLELRHEIEHRSTNRIVDAVSAKLQACCINFNDVIKDQFGAQYALERRLPIALQFVTFSPDQRALLKKASNQPRHVETMMEGFEQKLTPEQQDDPRFAYRVFMIRKTANRAPGADLAVELVPPGSDVEEKFSMALKEVEKRKYLPAEVVAKVRAEGFNCFTMDSHTRLWKRLDARDPAKGYGAVAVGKQWCWYETWLNRVLEECRDHPDRYRAA